MKVHEIAAELRALAPGLLVQVEDTPAGVAVGVQLNPGSADYVWGLVPIADEGRKVMARALVNNRQLVLDGKMPARRRPPWEQRRSL